MLMKACSVFRTIRKSSVDVRGMIAIDLLACKMRRFGRRKLMVRETGGTYIYPNINQGMD